MLEIGTRRKPQPPPPHVVFEALVTPNRDPARQWLVLEPDEVPPVVVDCVEHSLVVWTSLWPQRPDARIRFDLDGDSGGTALRWTLLVDEPAPSDSLTGQLRRRIQLLINAELRFSFGQ